MPMYDYFEELERWKCGFSRSSVRKDNYDALTEMHHRVSDWPPGELRSHTLVKVEDAMAVFGSPVEYGKFINYLRKFFPDMPLPPDADEYPPGPGGDGFPPDARPRWWRRLLEALARGSHALGHWVAARPRQLIVTGVAAVAVAATMFVWHPWSAPPHASAPTSDIREAINAAYQTPVWPILKNDIIPTLKRHENDSALREEVSAALDVVKASCLRMSAETRNAQDALDWLDLAKAVDPDDGAILVKINAIEERLRESVEGPPMPRSAN